MDYNSQHARGLYPWTLEPDEYISQKAERLRWRARVRSVASGLRPPRRVWPTPAWRKMAAPVASGLSRQVGEAGGKVTQGGRFPAPSAACEVVAEGSGRSQGRGPGDCGQHGADGASAPGSWARGCAVWPWHPGSLRGGAAGEQAARVWEREEPGIGWKNTRLDHLPRCFSFAIP